MQALYINGIAIYSVKSHAKISIGYKNGRYDNAVKFFIIKGKLIIAYLWLHAKQTHIVGQFFIK